MTAAQRETLEAELATCEVAGRSFPLSKANAALADALRAALGTCGNCARGSWLEMKPGAPQMIWCHVHERMQPEDDGCVKGWTAKEGA